MYRTKQTLSMSESKVLQLIHKGASNAIQVSEISAITGLEVRTIRSIIADLCIKYSVPIVSKRTGEHKGVYIASTEEEKLIGLSEFERQVQENIKRINAVKKADVNQWERTIVYQKQIELVETE